MLVGTTERPQLGFPSLHLWLCGIICDITATAMDCSWEKEMKQIVQKCDNFNYQERLLDDCLPFFVNSKQLGVVRRDAWTHLKRFPSVFDIDETKGTVKLAQSLTTREARTKEVERVLIQLKEERAFDCLLGWRNEVNCMKKKLNSCFSNAVVCSEIPCFEVIWRRA
eukprot:m.61711 g.61711  ORF g.61711 m.61711 type:complete len:167 (+) comp35020_c0_seq12:251-751(+)